MKTKYDVDDIVYLQFKVTSIHVKNKNNILYNLLPNFSISDYGGNLISNMPEKTIDKFMSQIKEEDEE